MPLMACAHAEQNVHSWLQMRASASCASGAAQRSQTARISRAMARASIGMKPELPSPKIATMSAATVVPFLAVRLW
jgi:hypothetical protein